MSASILVFLGLMNWSFPVASNQRVFAFCWPFFTVYLLVVVQGDAWELLAAELKYIFKIKRNSDKYKVQFHLLESINDYLIFHSRNTHLAFAWQLAHCLLDSQVSRCVVLGYFHTAVWASRYLIAQPKIIRINHYIFATIIIKMRIKTIFKAMQC